MARKRATVPTSGGSGRRSRLELLIRRQDEAAVGEFHEEAVWSGPAPAGHARGKPAIAALLGQWLARSYLMSWEWERLEIAVSGDIAWLSAEGTLVLSEPGPDFSKPCRLAGVLQHDGRRWLWRLFDVTEPARP